MTLHGASSLDTLVSAADVDITRTVQRESNATGEHRAILDSDVLEAGLSGPQQSTLHRAPALTLRFTAKVAPRSPLHLLRRNDARCFQLDRVDGVAAGNEQGPAVRAAEGHVGRTNLSL